MSENNEVSVKVNAPSWVLAVVGVVLMAIYALIDYSLAAMWSEAVAMDFTETRWTSAWTWLWMIIAVPVTVFAFALTFVVFGGIIAFVVKPISNKVFSWRLNRTMKKIAKEAGLK